MKVLVVRVGAMGDVLHALPGVAALRRARPDWDIGWAVDPRWSPPLVDGDGRGPLVDRVHLVQTKLWSAVPLSRPTLRSVLALRKELRAEKYDVAIDMQGTLRSAVIAKLSGAPEVVGYGDPRETLARTFYSRTIERRGVHVVPQGANLLGQAFGLELAPVDVVLPSEDWAEHWAEHEAVLRRPMCVLAAGGGWGANQWPPEKFGALAIELGALGFDVVINMPRKDDPTAARVVAASDGACRAILCNVTGLIALLRRSDLVVGGDSGPVHLAAALGVPVVALFGPTDPARNGPWGPGKSVVVRDPSSVTTYKRTEATEAGLAKVTVATVMAAVRELI